MKKLVILAVAVGATFWQSHAHAAVSAACGLPDSKPLWIDYAEGAVGFRVETFGKPGAVPGGQLQERARLGQTEADPFRPYLRASTALVQACR